MSRRSPAELQSEPPVPVMPARPARPLSTWALLKALSSGSLAVLDDELFEELIVSRRYGLVSAVFVSDPAGVRRVLVDNFDNYPRVPTIRRLFEAEVGTGTLGSEGETWRRHRRIATPALDQRSLKSEVPALIALAERLAVKLDERVDVRPVDMEWFAGRMLMRMVNLYATGGDERAMPIMKWLSTVPRKPRPLDIVPKPEWLSRLLIRRRLDDRKAESDAYLRALIGRRRMDGYDGPRDLLWRLAHTADRQTGALLSDEETRDEAASIIAAGDATIRPLTWLWYLLETHPEVERRLHAELDEAIGDRAPTPEDLTRLPYLRLVLDEVMRLYPPIPTIVRRARSADMVCGRRVPRGAIVAVIPYVIHRHRKLWSNPDGFDPDRFLASSRSERQRLAFLPYAAGPRVCPGASVANANLLISIIALARRYRFRLVKTDPIEPFGGITMQPRGGLQMRVERR